MSLKIENVVGIGVPRFDVYDKPIEQNGNLLISFTLPRPNENGNKENWPVNYIISEIRSQNANDFSFYRKQTFLNIDAEFTLDYKAGGLSQSDILNINSYLVVAIINGYAIYYWPRNDADGNYLPDRHFYVLFDQKSLPIECAFGIPYSYHKNISLRFVLVNSTNEIPMIDPNTPTLSGEPTQVTGGEVSS